MSKHSRSLRFSSTRNDSSPRYEPYDEPYEGDFDCHNDSDNDALIWGIVAVALAAICLTL